MVLTSPRLPAGLLAPDAWRAIEAAGVVAAADVADPLPAALTSAGVAVVAMADATAQSLTTLAETEAVVWLADDADDALTTSLAELVVRRTEGGPGGAQLEIMMGSFDPVGARLLDAVTVMDTLRQECPWDQEQTHESLVPYLVEETYEVIEAIEAQRGRRGGAAEQLREELGDLLLQVLFHARLATEDPDAPFTIDDVAAGLVEKLVRRHPHVFADTEVSGPADVESNWEQIKRAEKGRGSALDGIPAGLPALSLADSVIGRALRADAALSVPAPHGRASYTQETLGDALFAVVAAAHAAGLDAEQALRARVRREIASVRAGEQRAAPANEQHRR